MNKFVYLSKDSSIMKDDETKGMESAAAELSEVLGKNNKARQQKGSEGQRWQRQTSGEKQQRSNKKSNVSRCLGRRVIASSPLSTWQWENMVNTQQSTHSWARSQSSLSPSACVWLYLISWWQTHCKYACAWHFSFGCACVSHSVWGPTMHFSLPMSPSAWKSFPTAMETEDVLNMACSNPIPSVRTAWTVLKNATTVISGGELHCLPVLKVCDVIFKLTND